MAWRVGVNDTQQLAAALGFEELEIALCRCGRTHRGWLAVAAMSSTTSVM